MPHISGRYIHKTPKFSHNANPQTTAQDLRQEKENWHPFQSDNQAGKCIAPPPFSLKAGNETGEQKNLHQLKNIGKGQSENPVSNPKKTKNDTGLPDKLKLGIESLSGYSLDDVKVHFNSNKPDQLQANAYAQGSNIYIAPGQEALLPHEAWHVVQQKQGRVNPTIQEQGKQVNDDPALEKEADKMGEQANNFPDSEETHPALIFSRGNEVVQKSKLKSIKNSAPIPSPFSLLSSQLPNVPLHLNVNDPTKTNNPSSAQTDYIRPEEVEAEIVGARRKTGMRLPSAVPSSVGNLGDQERLIRRGERIKTYQGGHLIGDELLDGSVDSMVDWNLAPQHEGFNHPVYFQLEEAIKKGPVGPDGKPNRQVPIKVNVSLEYEGDYYSITVQDLIDRGIVPQAAVVHEKISPAKGINLPFRVPTKWNATAQVIGGQFPPFLVPPSVPAALAPSTGFPPAISPSEFLVQSPQLGHDAAGQWMFAGGPQLSLSGMQGSIDPGNTATYDPSKAVPPTSAPLPTLPPVLGVPFHFNTLLTTLGGDLITFKDTIQGAGGGITATATHQFISIIKKRYSRQIPGPAFQSRAQFIEFVNNNITKTPGGKALMQRFRLDTSLSF